MDQLTKLLLETAKDLFAQGCDPEVQKAAEEGEFQSDLWQAIEDNGLPLALVTEEHGGVELGLEAACAVLRVAGAFALPVPLADTMLGAAMLSGAGLGIPEGPLAVAAGASLTVDQDGHFHGIVSGAPWLGAANHVVLAAAGADGETWVALVPSSVLSPAINCYKDPAGEPMGDLNLALLEEPLASNDAAISNKSLNWLENSGALMRVSLTAGALDRILDLCIEHTTTRIQFGRVVAKFQAVQNLVAVIAGETAAISVSAPAAVRAWEQHQDHLAVACAKTRASEAAGTTARIAHQVHAAIGYTQEHILHRFTRRLWSWRDQYGDEVVWSQRVGEQALNASGDGFWPLFTHNG